MNSEMQVLSQRYLSAKEKLAQHEMARALHRGQRTEIEYLVAMAEQEAERCQHDEGMEPEIAHKASIIEDELIKAGIPTCDIWHMDPMEFASKWQNNVAVKHWLCREPHLPKLQQIAAKLSCWRIVVPAAGLK